jgi:hypothetical protein
MPRLHGYREFLCNTDEEIAPKYGDDLTVSADIAVRSHWIHVQRLPATPTEPPHDDFPVARVVRWSGRR